MQIPGRSLQRTYRLSGEPGTVDPMVIVTGEFAPVSLAEIMAIGASNPQAVGSVSPGIQ